MLKRNIFFLFFLCLLSLMFADEERAKEGESHAFSDEETAKTNLDVEIDDIQKKIDVLHYGLENDVINLVNELKSNKDESLNNEMKELFLNTKSSNVRVAVLEFFSSIKAPLINEKVLEMLENVDDYKIAEAKACFAYVAENDVKDAISYLRSIIENKKNNLLEGVAIALSSIGGDEEELLLIELYNDIDEEDEKKREIIKEAIIKALEKVSSTQSLDFLLDIIENEGESATLRAFAVSSLSNIGTDEVLKKLISIYSSSSEPILRTSCVKAIAKFEGESAKKLILEALKDNYYKVRLEAISAIGEAYDEEICNSLLFRAKSDPELTVKLASIEVLSKIHNNMADEWMLKAFNDEKTSNSLRMKIASCLLENNFEFIIDDVEKKAIQSCKDEKEKFFRYEVGKVISKIKNERTINIAECYIRCKDVFTKSLGLDMFALNRYSSLSSFIEEIAGDEKMGALQKRAKDLLKKANEKI